MGALLVVGVAEHVQRDLKLSFVRDMAYPQHLLERGSDMFDAAIHPRAVRQCPLVANSQPSQSEGEDPRGEHRFVVGTDRLRLAVVLDGIQQQTKDVDGCAFAKSMRRQHSPAGMIEDA